jgi:uncharacterized protein (TIGR02145 family)
MITPAIRYISSFQDATNSSSIPVPTPVMVDGRIWDQKNLNVSTYRSGRVIPQVKTGWSTLTTGAWRYYNDNPASAAVYGRLYNWYAMMGIYDAASLADPSLRDNIAPVDWEVATYGEWITLRNILGRSTAAIALKESGPAHWGPTNTGTNSSFFTALPGGYKLSSNNTGFNRLGSYGYWWPKDATGYFRLDNISNALGYVSTTAKKVGFSIRLIKPTTVIPGFTTTYPTPYPTSLLGTGGDIPTSYSGTITERGIVYGTTINPTIANTKIQSGTGTGSYTINITTPPLSVNTEYFIRAYAISSIDGLVYAPNISVFTLNSTPTVFTNNTSQITTNSALSGGYVEDAGGLTLTTKGVCWSTSPNPTVALPTKTSITGSEIGAFVSEITGLALNTKYYVRAYATNTATTGYGQQEEFTTLATPSLNLIFNQYYAHHAYSLRKLSDTYDYRCVRVRRTTSTPSVTTTTVDVFFNSYSEIGLYSDILYVSGTVTLATTLGEFADGVVDGFPAQDIYVVTWYDQSGNGKNPTNATAGQQPRLVRVDSGVATLETSEGKASVRFISANNQRLNLVDTSISYNNISNFVLSNAIAATNDAFFALNETLTTRYYIAGRGISYVTAGTFLYSAATGVNRLYETISGISTTSAYINGIIQSPSSVTSSTVTNAFIKIGSAGAPANFTDGYISEVISFIGTPDRLNIEQNMMDYYGIQRLPLVTTADVNYIDPTGTAIGGGNLIDEFGITPTTKGVCWNTFQNPAIDSGAVTNDGTGIGAFTSNLNFLSAYTQYYVRAYASNSLTTSYGEEKQFITGNAPYVFILDAFPSAHHAYSLRKLRTAYTGFCLRVRRTAATSTEVNVGFDTNGTISFSSPISFASGTATNAVNLGEFAQGTVDGLTAQSIFVVTWYDQSGNGKNPSQTTAGFQPRLVNVISGVATLETSGGKVAVRFINTSSTRLSIADATANINNMSSYYVGQFVTTATDQVAYTIGRAAGSLFYFPYIATNTNVGYGAPSNSIQLEIGKTTARRLYEVLSPSPLNSAVAQGWTNGVPKNTYPLASGLNTIIQLGGQGAIAFLDGYIQEVIGWQSNTYRGEKEMNINNYWQIYV